MHIYSTFNIYNNKNQQTYHIYNNIFLMHSYKTFNIYNNIFSSIKEATVVYN